MQYRVYENGKRCAEFGSTLKDKGWSQDTFNNKYDAEIYALLWAYPYTRADAEANHIPMELGVEYDFSMGTTEILMKIMEVDDEI